MLAKRVHHDHRAQHQLVAGQRARSLGFHLPQRVAPAELEERTRAQPNRDHKTREAGKDARQRKDRKHRQRPRADRRRLHRPVDGLAQLLRQQQRLLRLAGRRRRRVFGHLKVPAGHATSLRLAVNVLGHLEGDVGFRIRKDGVHLHLSTRYRPDARNENGGFPTQGNGYRAPGPSGRADNTQTPTRPEGRGAPPPAPIVRSVL